MMLAINLATRGRPALLNDTIRRTLANIELPNTRLMVSIDDDDRVTCDAIGSLPLDKRIIYDVAPREDALGDKYNRVMSIAADVYLTMVDYAPHVTPGFDRKILDAAALFPDGIGAVYNKMANLSFPEINAVTRRLAQKMGGIYPAHFPYWFVDHWLDDIARMIDRIAVADVAIDTSRRPGTMDRREPAFWSIVFDALQLERRRIAHDIIRSPEFQETEWRKKLLLNGWHRLIEQRSVMVNGNVRAIADAWAAQVPPEPVDERYRRLRASAYDLLMRSMSDLQATDERQVA